jgi:DNA-binding MarR family transcriptional regulator
MSSSRNKTVSSPSGLPSSLEDHLGYWLRYVSNHVSAAFARRLQGYNITVSEWVALRQLYDSDLCSPGELGLRMGMTKGAVSRLIERLQGKGLLTRSASAKDGRAQVLRIAAAGKQLVPQLARLADENDRAFFSVLPQPAQEQLLRAMRLLVEHHKLKQLPTD